METVDALERGTGKMTEDWREELIERMANELWRIDLHGVTKLELASYLLSIAEPVIWEQTENALREDNERLRQELAKWVNYWRTRGVETEQT